MAGALRSFKIMSGRLQTTNVKTMTNRAMKITTTMMAMTVASVFVSFSGSAADLWLKTAREKVVDELPMKIWDIVAPVTEFTSSTDVLGSVYQSENIFLSLYTLIYIYIHTHIENHT